MTQFSQAFLERKCANPGTAAVADRDRPPQWPMLLLVAVLCGSSAGATAAGMPACSAPIRAGLSDFGMLHSADSRTGVNDDLIEELTRRSGCRIMASELPRVRILSMLEAGTLDMAFSSLPTPERMQYAHFVFYGSTKNMAVLHRSAGVKNQRDFLANRRLNMCELLGQIYDNPVYGGLAEQLRRSGRLTFVSSFQSMYDMFSAHRCDLIVQPAFGYRPQLQLKGLEQAVTIADWAPQERRKPFGMMLSKATTSAADAKRWQVLMEAIRRDGTLMRIYQKYLPPPEAAAMHNY